MKRLEAGQLPAPPDVSDLVKEEQVEDRSECPPQYRDMRCPCGMKYEDCMGFLFMDRDETFEAMIRDRNKT